MTESKPPDPPSVIAAKYAQAATQAVSDLAKVATDAYDKINGDPTANPKIPPGKYTPKDAIATCAQLAAAAAAGAMTMARVGLQVQWDRRILLVADNVASIVATGIDDVIDVAEDLAKDAGPKSYKKQQQNLVDAAIKLTGIGAIRGAEIMETVVAGPGPYLDPLIRRSFNMTSTHPKPAHLAVTKLERTTDKLDIRNLVTIDPPSFILQGGAAEFSIAINTAGLPSGVYEGVVTATDIPPDTQNPAGSIRTLNITIAIPDTEDPPAP